MTFAPRGRHLIAGDWIAGTQTFTSRPVDGPAHAFTRATPKDVAARCRSLVESAQQGLREDQKKPKVQPVLRHPAHSG